MHFGKTFDNKDIGYFINATIKFLVGIALMAFFHSFRAQNRTDLPLIHETSSFTERSIGHICWMKDNNYYVALENNRLVRRHVRNQVIKQVVFDADRYGISIYDFEFNANEDKILILSARQIMHRRSFTGQYHIYDLTSGSLLQLSDNGAQSYATFSPTSDQVAFVRENNIFIKDLLRGEEIAITIDKKNTEVINGASDWIYEEEFYMTRAYEWSPDGRRIAFLSFDEKKVQDYEIQKWHGRPGNPVLSRYKYPKPGENIPTVTVRVYDLTSQQTISIDLKENANFYIPHIQWTRDPSTLVVCRLNRLQNKIEIFHVDAHTGTSDRILIDKAKTYHDTAFALELVYLNDGQQFIYASERDGYKHFYLYGMKGKLVGQVTSGKWEATTLAGLRQQHGEAARLYYLSTEGSSLERHLYSINLDGSEKQKLTKEPGIHEIKLNTPASYYLDYHRSASSPLKIFLKSTTDSLYRHQVLSNDQVEQKAGDLGLAHKEFFTIPNGDIELNAYLLKPLGFDSTKRYPLLFYQYNGPGKQAVMNDWAGANYLWHQTLARQGYIVAVIDCRGTGGRGGTFKRSTYKALGTKEVEDMSAAARYMGELPFIDKNRIGIWGWSYGGYVASMALLKYPGLFKMGMAVSPVTDWKLYNCVYTERYMQQPTDNPKGFQSASLFAHAGKLQVPYLLVHGTGDDNVHFEHSLRWQDKLLREGKRFESYFFLDDKHGINSSGAHVRLYGLMTDFLHDHL